MLTTHTCTNNQYKLKRNLFLSFIFISLTISAQKLITYANIPGRTASDQYICKVKFEKEKDTKWRDAFVLQTRAKEKTEDPENAYYDILRGFTASWISFESDFKGDNVVVEIAKKDGSPITKAMVRPVDEASSAIIKNGKAYITFSKPANVNVDINGQLEDNYTGFGYKGERVHTISLFANPVFDKPDTKDTSVQILHPNEDINKIGNNWKTLIFAPGVHEIGLSYKLKSNQTVFIPGDAVVKGTMHPKNKWGKEATKNFKIYGSGTFSSEHIVRHPDDDDNKAVKPFTYQTEGAHLEGFVVVDPAFHTFNMGHTGDANNINVYKNLKILAWRKNSDGVNAFRNSEVSNCFFRVQDDAFYLGAENVNQHHNTVWTDANGAVLFLQNIKDGSTCKFNDVKVIYQRSQWHWWNGGRIVSFRSLRPGNSLNNVHVKNIFVEDPLPAFPPFYGRIEKKGNSLDKVPIKNVVFENIVQLHDGVSSSLDNEKGKPRNTLTGLDENRQIQNITFKNCYFIGKPITSFDSANFLTKFIEEKSIEFIIKK